MQTDGKPAADQAKELRRYLAEVGDGWATKATSATPAARGSLDACEAEIKEALREATDPTIARLGGSELLDAASKLTDTVNTVGDELKLLPIAALAKLGAQRIAEEQKLDPSAARYDFYAGPSFALTPDGSWNNGAEILFRSNTGRLWEKHLPSDWYGQISSLFAYRALGGDQEVNLDGEDSGGTGGVSEFVSPFDAKGGVASVDLRLAGLNDSDDHKSAFGIAALGGAESIPLDAGDGVLTTLKARGGLGGLYRTSYSDGALGELFVGYIHDSRYKAEYTGEEKDSMERLALSGILQLPSFNKEGSLRLAARIFASTPISGGNASELRLSVLVAYDLRSVFSKL